jgi:hypothetical protein
VEDQIVNEWKLMKIEVGPKYTMNEIYHKVRTRWKERWKVDWEEEWMDPWQSWGQEGQLDQNQIRDYIDGERVMLLIQQKGGSLVEEMMNEEGFWDKFLCGPKWKKREWLEWIKDNPDWDQEWEKPEGWFPGEKEWFEEEDSWIEKIRRHDVANMKRLKEKGEDYWRKFEEEQKRDRQEKETKHQAKLKRKQEAEERWRDYCANQLKKLKEINHTQSEKEARWKEYCENQLREHWQKESTSGSEGHLLAHPDEVSAILTGGQLTSQEVFTLSERVGDDDDESGCLNISRFPF